MKMSVSCEVCSVACSEQTGWWKPGKGKNLKFWQEDVWWGWAVVGDRETTVDRDMHAVSSPMTGGGKKT